MSGTHPAEPGRGDGGMAFDEMRTGEGRIRNPYAKIADWLETVPRDQLKQRWIEAELFFRRGGITFAVYGDTQGEERIIPYDIVPRVLARAEWERLANGLEQRVKTLNLYLADIYGKQNAIKAGIVPPDLAWQTPAY